MDLKERLFILYERMGGDIEPELVTEALRHSSRVSETRAPCWEALEFLGDRLVNLAVAEAMFVDDRNGAPGKLHRGHDVLKQNGTLGRVGEYLGLADVIEVGGSIRKPAGITSDMRADCFEALVAAVYLTGGWERARAFVLTALRDAGEMT